MTWRATCARLYEEDQLRKAMENPFISEILLERNITLSGRALPALKNLRRLTITSKCGATASSHPGDGFGTDSNLLPPYAPYGTTGHLPLPPLPAFLRHTSKLFCHTTGVIPARYP